MSVLVVAEHDNSELKSFTLNTVNAASKIDTDVHVLVAGNKCEKVCKEVSAIPLEVINKNIINKYFFI